MWKNSLLSFLGLLQAVSCVVLIYFLYMTLLVKDFDFGYCVVTVAAYLLYGFFKDIRNRIKEDIEIQREKEKESSVK